MASGLIALLVTTTTALAYVQLRHQRELLRLQGRIASLVFGLIRGFSKLRTGGAEKRAYAQWAEEFTAQRRRTYRARGVANVQAVFNAVYGVFTSLALFAMMGLAMEGGLSVSRFLAFSAAFGQVLICGVHEITWTARIRGWRPARIPAEVACLAEQVLKAGRRPLDTRTFLRLFPSCRLLHGGRKYFGSRGR